MDFELPHELRLLKEQLRHFVDTEIIPTERDAYEGPSLKLEVKKRLECTAKEMGLWLIDTPPEYGGLGLSLLARVIIWEEMGRDPRFLRAKRTCSARKSARSCFSSMSGRRRTTCFP